MDVLIDRTSRFTPSYDLQYRFKTPSTFNYNSRIFRPHTSDCKASSLKSNGQIQFEALTQAHDSPVEAFRRSLEKSLMIIHNGQSDIDPTVFTNLNKIHILNLKQERSSRQSSTRNSKQRSMNRRTFRPWTSDEGLYAARRNLWSERSSTQNIDSRASGRHGADELTRSFVHFISKIDHQSTISPKTYQHHSEYLANGSGPEDRCQRCAGYPQIRIDGRNIGGLSGAGSMARQHCDVLGMTMCPDCIRTRKRNDHFRKCNASVSERVLDVYKLAVARQRIPSLISISDAMPYRSSSRQGDAKVISVASLDNSGKHVTKISIEATEMPDINIKHDDEPIPKRPAQTTKVPEHNTDSDASSDESSSLKVSKEDNTTESEAANAETSNSDSMTHDLHADSITKTKCKSRRKSPNVKSKLFNRGVVPSPNYFSDMSDLQRRIRSHRKSKRIHFLEIEALAEELQTRQQEDKAKIESGRDDSHSETSCESSSPKPRRSPKIYEPPILFGQRPSVLGAAIE